MIPQKRFFRWRFLVPLFALLSSPAGISAETVRVGGTGTAMRSFAALAETFKKSHPDSEIVFVPGLGSRGGKKALLSGRVDISLASDPLKESELNDGLLATEYGRTPFVFASSKKIPVSGMSLQEILQIYNGKKTEWPDRARLRLILRPEGDSDNGVLREISPAMAEAVKNALARPGMTFAATDQDSADAIESVPGGFGTSNLALIISEKRPLKALAIDGIVPSSANLANGSYRYHKIFYLVAKPKTSPSAREFMAFVLSPAGRAILTEMGHWVGDAKPKR
jgi:phosphate transport system substrate-binding protein